MPAFRHTSSTVAPPSACLRMNAICCSLNLDFFTGEFHRPAFANPSRKFFNKEWTNPKASGYSSRHHAHFEAGWNIETNRPASAIAVDWNQFCALIEALQPGLHGLPISKRLRGCHLLEHD